MSSSRISREQLSMEIAMLLSKRSTCKRRQVGCIAVRDGRRIAEGYNGAPPDAPHCEGHCDTSKPCTHAIHAEANMIAWCAKEGHSLEGSTVFITLSPCPTCAGLLIQAGVKKVIFFEYYRNPEPGLKAMKDFGLPYELYQDAA